MRSLILVVAGALGALSIAGCGGHSSAAVAADGCRAPVNERLDSRSTIHLFPGAPDPTYLTDPPTSGPHRLGLPYQGVVPTPIPRSSQVAMLESGYVIIQTQLSGRDALAGKLVSVAPPVGPLRAPVVATAWTWKLECGSLAPPALTAINAFVAAHRGVGFTGSIAPPVPST